MPPLCLCLQQEDLPGVAEAVEGIDKEMAVHPDLMSVDISLSPRLRNSEVVLSPESKSYSQISIDDYGSSDNEGSFEGSFPTVGTADSGPILLRAGANGKTAEAVVSVRAGESVA